MPKQLTVTAYSFNELNEKAKDKARQWMREGLTTEDLFDGVTEGAKEDGVTVTEWDADYGTAKVHCADVDAAVAYILENHGEGTDTYAAADAYREADVMIQSIVDQDDFETKRDEAINNLHQELGHAYGKMYRDEYTYRMSDEAIDEDIEANDYLFTAEGSRTTVLND